MDLQESARQLNVHYRTAYRWVRQGTMAATKIGQKYDVAPYEVERVRRERARGLPPPERARVRSWEPHVRRVYDAVRAGNEREAQLATERLLADRVPASEILSQLMGPVVASIDAGRRIGTISTAHAARASTICDRLAARVSVHPQGRPRGTVVVTTGPQPCPGMSCLSTVMAMALRADHWRVHHILGSVDPEHIADLADDVEADLVVMAESERTPDAPGAADELEQRLSKEGFSLLTVTMGEQVAAVLEKARSFSPLVSEPWDY